jgi:hypothetical protein
MKTLRRHGLRIAAWAAALLALLLVFTAYLDPHLMADLANRAWACF